MIIIGIAGGTGSGKTTVVRKIIERACPQVPLQSFHKIHIITISHPFPWKYVNKPISTIPMLLTGRSLNNRLPTCAKGIPLSSPPILI